MKRFTQKVGGPSQTTYVGSGKLQEIKAYIKKCQDAYDDWLDAQDASLFGDQTTPPSGHPSYSGGEVRCLECLFISAKKKENIDELREVLYKRVRELHVQKYPYNDFLYNDYQEFEN